MKIYCISEDSIYRVDEATPWKIECGRIKDYLSAVNGMKKRDEWKTTGKGAHFMNVEEKYYDTESRFLRSLGTDGERLIYTTYIDGVGGIYLKDPESGDETYIAANLSADPGRISVNGGKYCIDAGEGAFERHIAMLDPHNGGVDQITEGFTNESCPFISRRDPSKIYYAAIGYAQNNAGYVQEKSASSICVYDSVSGSLEDVISDPGYDHIKPSDTADGDLYYIRRRYQPMRRKSNIGKDILMFPVRIIKAIGGFLSIFSMIYGGEPLRTGGGNPAKSRNKDEREWFVEGNLINARRISEAQENGDEALIPSEWVLIRRSPDGTETVAAKSVMDYNLLSDGTIIYSDGSSVRRLNADGSSVKICRLKLANCITVIE